MKIKIAYIDDSPLQLELVRDYLEGKTFKNQNFSLEEFKLEVTTFDGFKKFKKNSNLYDFLLLDINLDHSKDFSESKEILAFTREHFPRTTIAMYSGLEDEDVIADFMFLGANNYIQKENDINNLHTPIIETHMRALQKRNVVSISPFPISKTKYIGKTIISLTTKISQIVKEKSIRSIFINGETGTGKEVVAELFQEASEFYLGKNVPFVRVNCGAIPNELIEAELFGSVKGAFTGATKDKMGYFEVANGGWIFLDEVGHLSKSAQNSLMRVVENNMLRRVGENSERHIDVRVLSATNKNLYKMSDMDEFRYDLIQRLNGAEIYLPPLRERGLPEFEEFVQTFAKQINPEKEYFIPKPTLKLLSSYDWPGNIRELLRTMKEMTLLVSSDHCLYPDSLPIHFMTSLQQNRKDKTTVKNTFEFDIKINKNFCKRKDIEQRVFTNLYDAFKDKLSLKEIGEMYGTSHATTIKIAKDLQLTGAIDLVNFKTRKRKSKKRKIK